MTERLLLVTDLGTMPYAEALELQRTAARARIDGSLDQDLLLLVEHPPVITTGRSTKAGHVLISAEALAARGVELFDVERGGDATFHGPGQLVGYPILDLKRHRQDLHWYLRQLERVLIDVAAEFGVRAGVRAGYTGVWVDAEDGEGSAERGAAGTETPEPGRAEKNQEGTWREGAFLSTVERKPEAGSPPRGPRKLASIGVHARDWVTWHGFALNVTTDLAYFDLLVPCGIPDVRMTSLEAEAPEGGSVDFGMAAQYVTMALSRAFGLTAASYPFRELGALLRG